MTSDIAKPIFAYPSPPHLRDLDEQDPPRGMQGEKRIHQLAQVRRATCPPMVRGSDDARRPSMQRCSAPSVTVAAAGRACLRHGRQADRQRTTRDLCMEATLPDPPTVTPPQGGFEKINLGHPVHHSVPFGSRNSLEIQGFSATLKYPL